MIITRQKAMSRKNFAKSKSVLDVFDFMSYNNRIIKKEALDVLDKNTVLAEAIDIAEMLSKLSHGERSKLLWILTGVELAHSIESIYSEPAPAQ